MDTFAIVAWKLSPTVEREKEEKEGGFFPFPARFSFRPRHSAASIIRGERRTNGRTNGCNFYFMTTVDGAEWSEKSEWGWEQKEGKGSYTYDVRNISICLSTTRKSNKIQLILYLLFTSVLM